MNPPRVFISYSHDSAPHKEWVLKFATTLRERGIDTVLDQWDLEPGNDLPHFMETELENCDYAIMICTQKYVEKANAGEGGVGYEKMIMTSSLLKSIDSNKVIPIVREKSEKNVPIFLSSKKYIDFSKDKDIEYSLDDLLRTLLKAPLYEKPEIGKNPFKSLMESKPDRTADGLKEAMTTIAKAFDNTNKEEIELDEILPYNKMHRLTFDRYLYKAIKKELIDKSSINYYRVTEKGIEYLISHEIIEE